MKKIFSNIGIAAVAVLGLCACSKDDEGGVNSNATPVIRYVRPTAAEAADSLLVKGFMGSTVAIIGENLAGVCEVWFNDRRATTLNPNMVTGSAVIVAIPSEMYEEQNDLIRVVTRKRKEATHPFVTMPPAPLPQSISPEYARAGDEVTITGKSFYGAAENVQVFFPGNVEAEVLSVEPAKIVARVPAAAANAKGQLTVKTPYGSTRSTFIYRDDRGMIFNFDDYPIADCWGALASAAELLEDEKSVSGAYLKIAGDITNAGAGGQKDEFDVYYWQNTGDISYFNPYVGSLVPGDDPTKYQLRFELNIPAENPWEALAMQLMFAPAGSTNGPIWSDGADYPKGLYMPWTATGSFHTNGKWITVSLPLSDFRYDSFGGDVGVLPKAWEDFTIFFYRGNVEGAACSPVFLLDNFRIVPVE
ncbi:MAG: glycan-binding surface protein [Prevotellaceae bacterium]|jgi:hypothetical protein|nr:glycan-binding surface protein [Prevotellaceae bacterium]